MDLQGKVVVITGASSGIGRETAVLLGKNRCSVVLAARREEPLQEIAHRIEADGGRALVVKTDVSVESQVQKMIDSAAQRFGRIDVLINNAGFGLFAPIAETTSEQMDRIWQTNFMGTFYGIRSVLPLMKKQGSGQIITIASVVGKRATPLNGAYCATKFAQVGLMESLRMELRNTPLHCTVICPAATETEFIFAIENPGKRNVKNTGPIQTAGQVAEVIVKSIRKPSAEVMTQRLTRLLVLANAFSPGLVDWVVAKMKKDALKSL
jgi:hypothetical protein